MKTTNSLINDPKQYAVVAPDGTVVSEHDTWLDAYLKDRNAKDYSQDGNYLAEWDGAGYRPCQPE